VGPDLKWRGGAGGRPRAAGRWPGRAAVGGARTPPALRCRGLVRHGSGARFDLHRQLTAGLLGARPGRARCDSGRALRRGALRGGGLLLRLASRGSSAGPCACCASAVRVLRSAARSALCCAVLCCQARLCLAMPWFVQPCCALLRAILYCARPVQWRRHAVPCCGVPCGACFVMFFKGVQCKYPLCWVEQCGAVQWHPVLCCYVLGCASAALCCTASALVCCALH
jgi:hypothetical protein